MAEEIARQIMSEKGGGGKRGGGGGGGGGYGNQVNQMQQQVTLRSFTRSLREAV